jgi:hypothetical protein
MAKPKTKIELATGVVHDVPDDLRKTLVSDKAALERWQSLTPLGRNEFLCWVEDAKQLETRKRRIERTREELLEGKGRPCCWSGCIHRTDKAISPSQQFLLDRKRSSKAKAKPTSK